MRKAPIVAAALAALLTWPSLAQGQANLVMNPGVEANAVYWSTLNAGGDRTDEDSHSGDWSFIVRDVGLHADAGAHVDIRGGLRPELIPGETYRVGAWVNAEPGEELRLIVRRDGDLDASMPFTASGTWERITMDYVAPDPLFNGGIDVGVWKNTETETAPAFYVDDVSMTSLADIAAARASCVAKRERVQRLRRKARRHARRGQRVRARAARLDARQMRSRLHRCRRSVRELTS